MCLRKIWPVMADLSETENPSAYKSTSLPGLLTRILQMEEQENSVWSAHPLKTKINTHRAVHSKFKGAQRLV